MITQEENIFDLLGKGSTVYHSAILTSFTFDPYYFSNYYMPQMRSRGIKNVVVLIDSTQYDAILEDTETFKNFRHDFALIRVKNKTNGVFHPKVSLFLGDKQALALVGSGNLTYSGISHNKELWGAFCADDKESDEALIIKDIWDYLSGIIRLSSSEVAIQQLEWCKIYSAAIRDFESIESPQQSDFKFLYAKSEESIFSQIREILKGEVNTIKVIAPFYDMEGSLINTLKSSFKPKTIKCAIDESYGYIPRKIKDSSDIQFFHWHEIFGSDNKFELAKKLHAKAIQFETSEGTFFVLGSANATSAAFGLNSHSFNDEANIIIHSDKEDFFKKLGIDFGKQCVKSINDFHSVAKYSIRSANEALITHITLCERHLHDKLYISFDKIVADAKIRLCLDDGYRDFDFNKDGIDIGGLGKIQYAVAILGDKEISNKALVLDFADLVKRNPDSKYTKIESLFHTNNGDWDDNIAKVLSYVNFDVKDKSRTSGVSKGLSDTSAKSETVISKEQFDNTKFSKSVDANLYSLNMRILDQIQFFNSNKQENDDEIDEYASMEDLVTGNAQDDSQKRRILKSHSSKNEILSYLRRLKRHYDTIAKDFDNQDPFYRLQSQGVHFENNITCNDYSYILIALMLIFQRIAYPIKGDNNGYQYRHYFAELVGRFMMIYRAGYSNTNDFTYTKLEEMHRNFLVYSLLILSTSNMNKDNIKVWTLNLFETYGADIEKLTNCYTDFTRLLNEYKSLIKDQAIEAIDNAFKKYQNFLKTGGNIVPISLYSENFYFYRNKFGFIFCKKANKMGNDKGSYYRLEVVYPGIKDLEPTYTNNQTKVKMIEP